MVKNLASDENDTTGPASKVIGSLEKMEAEGKTLLLSHGLLIIMSKIQMSTPFMLNNRMRA